MYMPKGIIHYALSSAEGSSHVTISLERVGLSWADALVYGAAIVDNPDFINRWKRAIQLLISDYKGVPYLEAMPTWDLSSGKLCSAAEQSASTTSTDDPRLISQFIGKYSQLCYEIFPMIEKAYREAGNLEPYLQQKTMMELVDRVCSSQSAMIILEVLCKNGRLPVDVTSSLFRRKIDLRPVCYQCGC